MNVTGIAKFTYHYFCWSNLDLGAIRFKVSFKQRADPLILDWMIVTDEMPTQVTGIASKENALNL